MREHAPKSNEKWSFKKKLAVGVGSLALLAATPDIALTAILSEPTTPVLDTLTGR